VKNLEAGAPALPLLPCLQGVAEVVLYDKLCAMAQTNEKQQGA